jgi:(1->4)-alpha-D-glucan 1-alpha-D-glucosylmutase
MPSRNDIWLLFQTLAGLWPTQPMDEAGRESLRERVQAYMLKAVREAKMRTTWTCPDSAYEEALARYIDAVLRAGTPNPFADELQRLAARIAPFGFRNSLAMLALKCTVPGVPDVYQGTETWSFSLVDPDNRRPVDFARLAQDLGTCRALYENRWPAAAELSERVTRAEDGRIKQLATWRLLQLRKRWPQVFRSGAYVPLAAEGDAAEHVLAFARVHEDQVVVVVTARLSYTLCGGDDGRWNAAAWRGTRLRWPTDPSAARRVEHWRDWISGTPLHADAQGLDLQSVFEGAAGLPFAVLVAEENP